MNSSLKMHEKGATLLGYLRLHGASSSKVICDSLQISQASFSRMVKSLTRDLCILGHGKNTLYALHREQRGLGLSNPICRIDSTGQTTSIAELIPIQPRGYALVVGNQIMIHEGLPYFLADIAPQGYLGRSFPKRNPELQLPEQLKNWSDDDRMEAIARRGENLIGNLLLGRESFERFQHQIHEERVPIKAVKKSEAYEKMLGTALDGAVPESSAAGEQPKFLAFIASELGSKHVLVKFSPPIQEPAGQRWRDLLICEHIALSLLAAKGIPAAKTEIIETKYRVFLEVERFDRQGPRGRVGIISLEALDNELFGHLSGSWISAVKDLRNILSKNDAKNLRLLDCFGSLIGNTDRHFGNISFFWDLAKPQALQLAPIYDMLPMLYAPENGQMPQRFFKLKPAEIDALQEWKEAHALACEFWGLAAADKRISPAFRKIAKENKIRFA